MLENTIDAPLWGNEIEPADYIESRAIENQELTAIFDEIEAEEYVPTVEDMEAMYKAFGFPEEEELAS